MILNLSDISSEPLQKQISRQLRAMILAGELEADSEIPSIRALAREQKVSVITVQRAYEELTYEGLIYSRRGKGFFVKALNDNQKQRLALERLREMLFPIIENALAEGLLADEIRQELNQILNYSGGSHE